MEAATIREIARRSGYSKGVIEHFFDGKDELISGALDWINSGYERRVEKYAVGSSGLQALRKRIEVTLPMNRAIRDVSDHTGGPANSNCTDSTLKKHALVTFVHDRVLPVMRDLDAFAACPTCFIPSQTITEL